MLYADIRFDICDHVATLTMARDDRRNTLTDAGVIEEMVDAFGRAETEGARALILTGDGSAFSAGGNLKEAYKLSQDSAPAELRLFYTEGIHRIVKAVRALEIPVIAAVNGPAMGAGFDLALYCDIAIASERAKFCEAFINIGLIPGDGGIWIMQRRLGWQVAAELAFTGRVLDAKEALALGVVREVVAHDDLMLRAGETARQIAARPPLAIKYMKMLMRQAPEQGLDDHLSHCAALQALCQKSEDHVVALRAFLERSDASPTFSGS
ncbi:MAG: enoyl-CoA hydratase-related protein [Amphiplicatus sp.]